jgi:glucose/mannose-6-phosphate isomerase
MNRNGTIHSTILKDHHIPKQANRNSLVLINSVSGNTEEALSMLEDAARKSAEVICISAGGRLQEICEKNGFRHVLIPNLFLPRATLPYMIMPGLKIIDKFLETSISDEIANLPTSLAAVAGRISMNVPNESNVAKGIATFLQEGFVFCLSSPQLMPVATRFKNSLNENSKVHCVRESILEGSHNEIVPFSFEQNNTQKRKVLMLRWSNDPSIVARRSESVSHFFKSINQASLEFMAYERSLVNAILSSIYILDYATIYMALFNGIDPCPTPAIDILKKTSVFS